jgi:hypothetical protein
VILANADILRPWEIECQFDQLKPRGLITIFVGAAATRPLCGAPQQSADCPLIGFLSLLSSAAAARYIETFRSTLRVTALEFRFSEGSVERMRNFAAELVDLTNYIAASAFRLSTSRKIEATASTLPSRR